MVTSIDDLLTVLDHQTRNGRSDDALDAARALHHSGRLLSRLETEEPWSDLPAYCQHAARRLGESCTEVATAFEQRAGRVSDLAGALGDAIAAQRNEVSHADRWAIAARLGPIARRCAAVIIQSGPYESVPELLALGDRSRELQRAAVSAPPHLHQLRALDAPIPSGHSDAGADVNSVILEELSGLIGEFRKRDRHPATVREIVAVCHVASRVAGHILGSKGQQGVDAWTKARDTIGLFADGIALPPPGVARSRILEAAMRSEAAIRHAGIEAVRGARAGHADIGAGAPAAAMRCLRDLSTVCQTEVAAIGPTLAVPPGARPLSDDRVRQWLRKDAFRATLPDLFVALAALRSAGHASTIQAEAELDVSPSIA